MRGFLIGRLQEQCGILNLQRILVSSQEPKQVNRELGPGRIKIGISLPLETAYFQNFSQNQVHGTRGNLNVLQGFVFTSGTTGTP